MTKKSIKGTKTQFELAWELELSESEYWGSAVSIIMFEMISLLN